MSDTPTTQSTASPTRFWPVIGVIVLLSCYVALGLSASLRKSQTGDEGAHLTGGVTYWARHDYRCQPENGNWPQRWCGLPVWLAGYQLPSVEIPPWRQLQQWDYGDVFIYATGNDADAMLLRGRMMTTVLGVALGLLVFFCTRRILGTPAALLSMTLYSFSPTMLTHGFLITSDMAAALFFTAAMLAIWRLMHLVSAGTLLLCWFTLSGLFLSKFSAPIIVPMAALLLGIRLWRGEALSIRFGRAGEIHSRLQQTLILLATGVLLAAGVVFSIWASFGFRYAMLNPSISGPQETVPWHVVQLKSPRLNSAIGFAREHRLLPEGYLFGFAHVMRFSQARSAFLNGEYRSEGWLSFFPYCLAVKTPLELFLLVGLGAGALWRFRCAQIPSQAEGSAKSPGVLYQLTPLAVLFLVYWGFALTSHLNIGHRHLLPTYAPLFVLAGASAWWLKPPVKSPLPSVGESWVRGSTTTAIALRALVIGALVLTVFESLRQWPHYLAYFNPLIGGPRYGYKHLGDSSLDWSQDLHAVRWWLDAHPDAERDPRRLYFAFYGSPPPAYYGIHAERLPGFPGRWEPHVPQPLTGGTYIISATMLQCMMLVEAGRWNKQYEELYRQLRHNVGVAVEALQTPDGEQRLLATMPKEKWQEMFWAYENMRFSRLASFLRKKREPDDEIGYSILVYRLSDEDIAEALEGDPVELLDRPEAQIEALRLGRPVP